MSRLCLLLVTAFAFACEPARSPTTVSCTRDGHCPADGLHFCNLAKKVCEACDGTCASLAADVTAVDAADVAATPADTAVATEVAATTDATADGALVDAAAVALDAGPDLVPAAADVSSKTVDSKDKVSSCSAQCGKPSGGCFCDSFCEGAGDCCFDYEALCMSDAVGAPADVASDTQ